MKSSDALKIFEKIKILETQKEEINKEIFNLYKNNFGIAPHEVLTAELLIQTILKTTEN